jgi:hypothetical protein
MRPSGVLILGLWFAAGLHVAGYTFKALKETVHGAGTPIGPGTSGGTATTGSTSATGAQRSPVAGVVSDITGGAAAILADPIGQLAGPLTDGD